MWLYTVFYFLCIKQKRISRKLKSCYSLPNWWLFRNMDSRPCSFASSRRIPPLECTRVTPNASSWTSGTPLVLSFIFHPKYALRAGDLWQAVRRPYTTYANVVTSTHKSIIRDFLFWVFSVFIATTCIFEMMRERAASDSWHGLSHTVRAETHEVK